MSAILMIWYSLSLGMPSSVIFWTRSSCSFFLSLRNLPRYSFTLVTRKFTSASRFSIFLSSTSRSVMLMGTSLMIFASLISLPPRSAAREVRGVDHETLLLVLVLHLDLVASAGLPRHRAGKTLELRVEQALVHSGLHIDGDAVPRDELLEIARDADVAVRAGGLGHLLPCPPAQAAESVCHDESLRKC